MGKWSVDERYPWSKVASFDGDLSTEEVKCFVLSEGGLIQEMVSGALPCAIRDP